MKDKLSNLATLVLVVCALVVTGIVVRNEWTNPGPAAPPAPLPPLAISGWSELARGGSPLGQAGAPVTLVVFSDFQCPFCASITPTLRGLQQRYGDRLSVAFRHFPIEAIHPHARPAALAAECAGEQGRFEGYHDALFAAQESIGKASWRSVAAGAGVADLDRFDRCVREARFASRIDGDLRAAARIGVRGTPTLIVNGMMLRSAPTEEALAGLIDRALAAPRVAAR